MRILTLLLTGALVCGCSGEPGRVYKTSLAEAHKTLEGAGIPPLVFGTEEPEFDVVSNDPSLVAWVVKKDGAEALRLEAHLTAIDDTSTRVSTEIHGPTSGALGDVDKRLNVEHPEIKHMYEVALEENVSAALEHRAFLITKVYPAMAQASLQNMGNLMKQVDEVAAASNKQDRDNIMKAYAEERRHSR